MSPIFNFHLIDGTTAALVALTLMAGGGGTFAAILRTRRRTRQPDPEAVELGLTHAVQRRAVPGSADDAGVRENTIPAQDAGAAEQDGAVQGSVAFGVGEDEGDVGQGDVGQDDAGQDDAGQGDAGQGDIALGMGDDEGTFKVYGVGALEETGASDEAGTVEVCGAVEDGVALGVDAST